RFDLLRYRAAALKPAVRVAVWSAGGKSAYVALTVENAGGFRSRVRDDSSNPFGLLRIPSACNGHRLGRRPPGGRAAVARDIDVLRSAGGRHRATIQCLGETATT